MAYEDWGIVGVLVIVNLIYVYILLFPNQKLAYNANLIRVVLPQDTNESFYKFIKEHTYESSNSLFERPYTLDDYTSQRNITYKDWGKSKHDDFLLNKDDYGALLNKNENENENNANRKDSKEILIPSKEYLCRDGWIVIRSDLNYKYLWSHADENYWLGATATMETPVFRKAYHTIPIISNDCISSDGWILLKTGDSDAFVRMVLPNNSYALDEWVVKPGTKDIIQAKNDTSYHFLLEKQGYIMNRGSQSFLNVISEASYSVRGHSSSWDRTQPAGREYGAMMKLQYIEEENVLSSRAKAEKEMKEAEEQDQIYIKQIAALPTSTEKRVISFGLYGNKEKYTTGAIHNAELVSTYFPGWIARYYVTSDVPEPVISRYVVYVYTTV